MSSVHIHFLIAHSLFINRFRRPTAPVSWSLSVVNQRKVAICVIIIDELIHEDIWREWSETGRQSSAQFYIHAKHPNRIKSEWVRKRLITESYKPEWNSIEVVRALLAVLSAAVNDVEPAGRYVFCTESCIPVRTLDEVCGELYEEDVSWLDARHTPRNTWERLNCFLPVDPAVIPPLVRPSYCM